MLLFKRRLRRSVGVVTAISILGMILLIRLLPRNTQRFVEKDISLPDEKKAARGSANSKKFVKKFKARITNGTKHNTTTNETKHNTATKMNANKIQSLDDTRRAYMVALQAQHYNRDLLGLVSSGYINMSVYQPFRLPIGFRLNELRKEMVPYEMKLINNLEKLFNDQKAEFEDKLRILQKRVEKRIYELQHPVDCQKERKLVCEMEADCGLGCLLHHYGNCLFIGLGTNRTVVVKQTRNPYEGMEKVFEPLTSECEVSKAEMDNSVVYAGELSKRPSPTEAHVARSKFITGNWKSTLFAPFSIPGGMIDNLKRFHSDPDSWWIGQIIKHVTRVQPWMTEKLEQFKKTSSFNSPIVGVHVRRTDKIHEASYRPLSEYMEHVERWFDRLELRTGRTFIRKIYLATDDPNIAAQLMHYYPTYQCIQAFNIPVAKLDILVRFSHDGLIRAISDVLLLAQCDYFVGTFSSNLGRLVYELMQADGDRTFDLVSLDYNYHYWGGYDRFREATQEHQPRSEKEIELQVGDKVRIRAEKYTLYMGYGENMRTNKHGVYPISKSKLILQPAPYPGL